MGLNFNKSNGVGTISILHCRPDYPREVEFLNIYRVKNNPELDLKTIFYKAFSKAHPDWSILEIKLAYDD